MRIIFASLLIFSLPAVGDEPLSCPKLKDATSQVEVKQFSYNTGTNESTETGICNVTIKTQVYEARANPDCGGRGPKKADVVCDMNLGDKELKLELRTYLQLSRLERFFEPLKDWKFAEVFVEIIDREGHSKIYPGGNQYVPNIYQKKFFITTTADLPETKDQKGNSIINWINVDMKLLDTNFDLGDSQSEAVSE